MSKKAPPAANSPARKSAALPAPWKTALQFELPVLGHRNWIVIADSAYPAQTRGGIQTMVTGAGQLEVVGAVVDALAKTTHVKPTFFTDAELPFVADDDAPGIAAYRDELSKIMDGRAVNSMPHEDIIGKLDKAGELFKILILKTTLTLPYTSVFIQLDCGYWNGEAERKLRKAIKKAK